MGTTWSLPGQKLNKCNGVSAIWFVLSFLSKPQNNTIFSAFTTKTQSWQSKKSERLLDLMITGDHYNNNPPLSGLI